MSGYSSVACSGHGHGLRMCAQCGRQKIARLSQILSHAVSAQDIPLRVSNASVAAEDVAWSWEFNLVPPFK